MKSVRQVDISSRSLVIVMIVMLAIGAGVARLSRGGLLPWLTGMADTAPAQTEAAATRAEEIAVAVTVIDYRDPQPFLDRLRPLASDEAYARLRAAFVGLAWPAFEQQRLVISPSQVVAIDQGLARQGYAWQARRVRVVVQDPPPGQVGERNLIVQLVLEGGEWLLQSLLNEAQLAALVALPTSESQPTLTAPAAALPLPAPAPGADMATFVAREFARAYVAVDYREQDIWLERVQAVTSPEGYGFLQFVVLPELWLSAERVQLAIPYDSVLAEDLGVESRGETALESWQVRHIRVTYRITGADQIASDEFLIRVSRAIDASPDDVFDGWRARGIEE